MTRGLIRRMLREGLVVRSLVFPVMLTAATMLATIADRFLLRRENSALALGRPSTRVKCFRGQRVALRRWSDGPGAWCCAVSTTSAR